MLKQNVYILYPPGYCGSYLNWIINASDVDLSANTVKNPINKNKSNMYGGLGTSHLHTRYPTHVTFSYILPWILYNKPKEKLVYVVNSSQDNRFPDRNPIWAASYILKFDPSALIINITDEYNADIRKFGSINAITKWPIYFNAINVMEQPEFDPFNCADSIDARNIFFEKYDFYFPKNGNIDRHNILRSVESYKKWYSIRNAHNPHEVTPDQFACMPDGYNCENIIDLSLRDIVSMEFVDIFSDLLLKFDIADFDFTQFREIHPEYISTQENLSWFNDINVFRKTGKVSDYLLKHSLTQAFVLMERKELPTNWKTMSTAAILNYVEHNN